jgi:hypothetical protein
MRFLFPPTRSFSAVAALQLQNEVSAESLKSSVFTFQEWNWKFLMDGVWLDKKWNLPIGLKLSRGFY